MTFPTEGQTAPPASMSPRLEHAVAVTGIGAVTGWGWGVEPLWRGLSSGATAIAEPRALDTQGHRTHLASEVPTPPAPQVGAQSLRVEPSRWQRLSRADRFAVAAALEAWEHAGLTPPGKAERDPAGGEGNGTAVQRPRAVVGVFLGGSTAAMAEGEEFFTRLAEARTGHPRISYVATHPLDGPGNEVARELGITGPVESLSSACASGALAIGAALDALRCGEVDVAIAGGSDSLCQLTYAGFNSLRAVDAEPCSPFRQGRAGLNLGEGAGILVLERIDRAQERGRRPLALLLGAGASCDAHHMTAPHPRGEGAARAIRAALADAGAEPDSIVFVNAHGTGTPLNDSAEWSALAEVFGEHAGRLPVTATKAALGHLLGSSGAIEAVVTVLALAHGLVPPTPGRGPIDESLGVDLVVERPRPVERGAAVSTSFAFGGSNAALILGAAPDEGPGTGGGPAA
ncbi:MAG: beta-ketoacyl-[acyl-carrier-protein] synthase family protein [Holophagales bacterium]|nr:beta-ketoacyl-[acyl-carrier-protein] synthase family protein [Holophagales bacterium]